MFEIQVSRLDFSSLCGKDSGMCVVHVCASLCGSLHWVSCIILCLVEFKGRSSLCSPKQPGLELAEIHASVFNEVTEGVCRQSWVCLVF